MSKLYTLPLLALIAALAAAGCGGGSDSSSSSSSASGGAYGGKSGAAESGGGEGGTSSGGAYAAPAAAPNAEEGTTFVSLGSAPKVGMVLVDSKGFTLYDFHKDKGGQSACYGACAEGWPPLLTKGEPQPSNGASAGKLGTTKRKDGTTQVTYAGHPLYTFVGDKKPGEATGNDVSAFGAQWYALKGSGEEAGD
jgi:predicted lipoprotein with Yx(FWY)xxD motif